MSNLYYITRSYTHTSFTGGAIIREGNVNLLKDNGINVTVVTQAKSIRDEIFSEGFVAISPGRIPEKVRIHMERLGLLSDYLVIWANRVTDYLCEIVKPSDVIFSATGGDLASLIVGAEVKKRTGAKFVANFHDPVSFTNYYDERLGRLTHISRNKIFQKTLSNVDLVITSSNSYKSYLDTLSNSLKWTNHFGYIESAIVPCDFTSRKETKTLKAFYGGTLSKTQGPDLVYGFLRSCPNLSLDVFGHSGSRKTEAENINFYDSLPRNEFLDKVTNSYDVGFVSLADKYFGACIPSKIYEYINLGIPIIGFLPEGEARDIVNDNGYGYVALPNKAADLKKQVSLILKEQERLVEMNSNILRDRSDWSMNAKVKELTHKIKGL